MASNSSASVREQVPHSITNNILKLNPNNDDVRQRAWSLLRDKSLDEGSRSLIGYAMEIHDPRLSELVRRAEAGESVVDNIAATNTPEDDSTEQRVDTLAETSRLFLHWSRGDVLALLRTCPWLSYFAPLALRD